MKQTKIAQILNRLMSDKKIRVTELARQVNLPQPTVHRIAAGVCEHPHLSSLKPLAEYFGISVEQLKGHDHIPWLDRIARVPLITWKDALAWPRKKEGTEQREAVLTDAAVSATAYALKVADSSMDPVFPRNSTIIVDPERDYKDRSLVIVKMGAHPEAVFRQVRLDAGAVYLKALSPDFDQFKMAKLSAQDKVVGVVVQSKRDCEDLL